jgi:hypothetical protein
MLENQYKQELIPRIETRIPGCLVVINDPNYIQGIPDLTVFYGVMYAFLEVKASEKSKERPNQRYYIENHGGVFGAFIYPENEEEILNALQQAFGC